MAVDAQDNIYLAGHLDAPVDFGGGTLPAPGDQRSLFVASYEPTGGHRWSKTFGAGQHNTASGLAVDAAGRLYLVGAVSGSVDFAGDGSGVVNAFGDQDAFVASFDGTGQLRWAASMGGTGMDRGRAVAAGAHVLAVGEYTGPADFAGENLGSAGNADLFVISFDDQGQRRWARGFGSAVRDTADGVAIDAAGNAFVVGWFAKGALQFDEHSLLSGSQDAFVASLDAAGQTRWAARLFSALSDTATGVATDGPGNVYITGGSHAPIDCGGGPLPHAGGNDIYLASYTGDGQYRWARALGTAATDGGRAVTVDPVGGSVLLAGLASGGIDFGDGSHPGGGDIDAFVARVSAAGDATWSALFGQAGDQSAHALAVSLSGHVIVAGTFTGMLGVKGIGSASGVRDAFVMKLAP